MFRWRTSAGAISVSLQMLTNSGKTDGLYRGAIMSSGSPSPTGDITDQQSYYNIVVENAGCANASDTLECLRHVPADTLLAAAATLPTLLDYQVYRMAKLCRSCSYHRCFWLMCRDSLHRGLPMLMVLS